MGRSAAQAPTTPDAEPVGRVRASDTERDEVLARLREEFAAGRLSHDTFLIRMDAVLQARHLSELPPLLADLTPGPAGQPSVTGRLREALDRWLRSGVTRTAAAGNALRLTGGMTRAARDVRRPVGRGARGARGVVPPKAGRAPLPLQFPRGAGTLFSIGRDVCCDLAIADMSVSRVHARLERTEEGWLLTDLASTNGTRVNGWRVRDRVQVRAGDLVSFGRAEYWLSPAEGI